MRLQHSVFAIAALLLAACAPKQQEQAPAVAPESVEATPAASATAATPAAGVTWRAIGTEPFWGVRVEGYNLVFTTPEDQAGRVLPATETNADGKTVFSGSEGGQAYTLTLVPGDCSDGMSDRVFRFTAEFAIGDAHYRGCAAAPGDPWGE